MDGCSNEKRPGRQRKLWMLPSGRFIFDGFASVLNCVCSHHVRVAQVNPSSWMRPMDGSSRRSFFRRRRQLLDFVEFLLFS